MNKKKVKEGNVAYTYTCTLYFHLKYLLKMV